MSVVEWSPNSVGRPRFNEGYFEVRWVMPDGDLKGMQATYANERLRIILPANPGR